MKKILGIIGGMGPLATVNLYDKIVMLTEAKCDQEHLEILIYNNPSIPDRSNYILGKGESPLEYLIEAAKKLESMGADYLIMPCNTSHFFYDEIIKHIKIPFINMIDETAKYIVNSKGLKRIGLLSTEGTIKAKVYDKALEKYKVKVEKVTAEQQKILTKLIYGIKSGDNNVCIQDYNNIIESFKKRGIETYILGCTELSTLYALSRPAGNYIDPLEIISLKAISYGGKEVKKSKII